ncbi:efflux RND transporter periplasmic adaptor subunit [Dapis sp. BLCC M229]|uniref:efflux RND transporter periplasmic adaptor subunit n=1 Tax=Dapis sp. BLCC M229 TaxID=3400188 RepID=UPI003CF8F7B8
MKLVPKFLTTTLILTLITSIITYGCKQTSNSSSNPCFVEVKIVNPSEMPSFQSAEYVGNIVAKKKARIRAYYEGVIDEIVVSTGEKVIAGSPIIKLKNGKQIEAPFTGIVGEFYFNQGEFIMKGEKLTTVVDNQSFYLNFDISVDYSSRVIIGTPIEIIDNNNFKVLVTSKIDFISPETDQRSQTMLVGAKVSSQEYGFRDGQQVIARVILEKTTGIFIPITAVRRIDDQTFVFVVKEEESQCKESSLIAEKKPVKLGNIQGQNYQVVSGLELEDKIIVSNVVELKNGQPIQDLSKKTP